MTRIPLLTVLTLMGVAQAAKPDCATLQVRAEGTVHYSDLTTFPNPTVKHEFNLATPTSTLPAEVCKVKFTGDANSYTVQAPDTKTLLRIMNGHETGFDFDLVPQSGRGPKAGGVSVILHAITDPEHITLTAYQNLSSKAALPKDALIGVRINNGKLKPLLYEGTFSTYKLDAKTVKVIEMYVKSSKPFVWQQFTLDLRAGRLTVRKQAPFPTQ